MDTKSKNFKIIIIAVAAVVLLAAGYVLYRGVNRFLRNSDGEIIKDSEIEIELNVTLFKFYIGKDTTGANLNEIKRVLTDAVGDKIYDIAKGEEHFPVVRDEDSNVIDMGEGFVVTFSILDEREKIAAFTALADKYGITPEHLPEGLGRDIYRGDYAKK